MPPIDKAGRKIAGLLTYSPGPGIYSRLERAIQAMPENVRSQELPGLLKRYKDGVPGWELKATDLDSVIAGRAVVPREELLWAVRERSPVYTHHELVQGGSPATVQQPVVVVSPGESGAQTAKYPAYSEWSSPIGKSGEDVFGPARYENFGQGGRDYTELLLLQPDAPRVSYGNHWDHPNAVAHARFDTHGDALRINELQSDLGIHNRKVREQTPSGRQPPEQLPAESDLAYVARLEESGWPVGYDDEGEFIIPGRQKAAPFPLEDAWADLLIKRMALEAARKGHRAIEVASPRAIADKVGGNIDNYEHFYGKVVPGALERLGRKMGGLTPDGPEPAAVGRRYLMSDEMRRRLIQAGVGAAVAGGIMSQDDLIQRLGQ